MEIRALEPDIGILVLSHHLELRYLRRLFLAGAAGLGYLLKQRLADHDRFFEALEQVRSGGTVVDPELVSVLLRRRGGAPIAALTPRQVELLSLIAEGRTNAAIAVEHATSEDDIAEDAAIILEPLGLAPDDAPGRVLALVRSLGG